MNLEKVFIGYTNTGKEHLLYKKTTLSGISFYVDLNNGKIYDNLVNKIDLRTILKKKYLREKKIIEYYNLDRNKKIVLDNIVIGDLILHHKNLDCYVEYKNMLFELININGNVKARDLIDNAIYDIGYVYDNISRGENYVLIPSMKKAREYLDYDDKAQVVNKKRILERIYQKNVRSE